jgi:hypothetical protein
LRLDPARVVAGRFEVPRMNRMLRSLVVGVFAAAGVPVLTPACADNNSSIFIAAVLYDPPPQCMVTADLTSTTLGGGTLDLAFRKTYDASLLIGNQLASRGSKQTLRTETSRVTLRGAEITVSDSTGADLYNFSVNGTGFVDVNRGEDAGLGIFDAELIPASIGDKLLTRLNAFKVANNSMSQETSQQIVAKVRVFGDTLGNEDLTSSELSFPITYCEGCLIEYPSEANLNGKCGAMLTNLPQGGCRIGQDDPIDCRSCSSTLALCDDIPTGM